MQSLFLEQLTADWHISKVYIHFLAFEVSEIRFYDHGKAGNIVLVVRRNILFVIFFIKQRSSWPGRDAKFQGLFQFPVSDLLLLRKHCIL